MSKAPAFQLYSNDFFVDTITWELEELGLYTRLLFVEWSNGPLENDLKKLAKIAGISPKKFTNLFQIVSTKFVQTDEGKLINIRLEETRQEQLEYRKKQQEKGLKSAEKRWGTPVTTVITTVEPQLQPRFQPDHQPESNPSSSSSPSHNKKDKTLKTFCPNSAEIGLVDYFISLILQNRPEFKEPNKQVWARSIDLMLRVDKRTPEEMRKIMKWCQQDEFWMNNVLSTEKLRKQYDQLAMKMGGTNGNGNYSRGSAGKVTQGTSAARNLGDGQAYPVDCEETIGG